MCPQQMASHPEADSTAGVDRLDWAFFRILFCALGLAGGCIVQKKGLEAIKALGMLVFS